MDYVRDKPFQNRTSFGRGFNLNSGLFGIKPSLSAFVEELVKIPITCCQSTEYFNIRRSSGVAAVK